MGRNKVVYGTTTLIDLTSDTVTPSNLEDGATAHDRSGNVIRGNLKVQNYYSGQSVPASTLGGDGDLYFLLSN